MFIFIILLLSWTLGISSRNQLQNNNTEATTKRIFNNIDPVDLSACPDEYYDTDLHNYARGMSCKF